MAGWLGLVLERLVVEGLLDGCVWLAVGWLVDGADVVRDGELLRLAELELLTVAVLGRLLDGEPADGWVTVGVEVTEDGLGALEEGLGALDEGWGALDEG
ncbi:MAG: hypothetical protein LBL92_06670 [Propionibacteriaceae bacterium]|jgi:hypothetical protein|nr:hypothetical protein [Propionibacteriaceae bacterium]